MVSKQKPEVTFAVFQRSELSPLEIANIMVKFEAWEQNNLGAAETSEGRLAVWDETQNGSKLAEIFREDILETSSRLRSMFTRD
jgi:hypothetical protein